MALFKEWASSAELCQSPTLVLPRSYLSRLDPQRLKVLPRNELNDRSVKEYLKTAAAIAEEPWNLHAAATYLSSWVRANQSGDHQEPEKLHFIFSTTDLPTVASARPPPDGSAQRQSSV